MYLSVGGHPNEIVYCVALSSAESEYISLNECVRETIWLNNVLNELELFNVTGLVPEVFCDNRSAICLSMNRIENRSSKHIEIRYHYIREKCEAKLIELKYVPTTENIADLFTKSLKKESHIQNCIKLALERI